MSVHYLVETRVRLCFLHVGRQPILFAGDTHFRLVTPKTQKIGLKTLISH